MGYTHYWSYDFNSPEFKTRFPDLVRDTRSILLWAAASDITIAGPDGEPGTHAEVTDDTIALNGAGDDSHETLYLALHPTPRDVSRNGPFVWAFCKTARKPYDTVVAAVLLRARQLMPESFCVSSDGAWDDEWAKAREVVLELFGPHETDTMQDPLDVDTCGGPPSLGKH